MIQPRKGPLEHFPGERERELPLAGSFCAPYPVQSAAATPQYPSDPGAQEEAT